MTVVSLVFGVLYLGVAILPIIVFIWVLIAIRDIRDSLRQLVDQQAEQLLTLHDLHAIVLRQVMDTQDDGRPSPAPPGPG